MAVYRPRQRFNPFIIALIVVALVVAVFFLAVNSASSPPNPLTDAQAKALEAAESLDVFSIEYPKYVQGQSSGAAAALSRARSVFISQRELLKTMDVQLVERLIQDFSTLEGKFVAKASPTEVAALAEDMRMRLLALGSSK